MKLNSSFIKHTMGDTCLVIPVEGAGFHGVVKGNKSVGVIVDCLIQGATEPKIVDALYERFDGDRAQMARDVADVLAQLRSIGAIDEGEVHHE